MTGTLEASPQTATQGQPILARQHEVEYDEVYSIVFEQAIEVSAVGSDRNVKVVGAKISADQTTDFDVVFHDKNMRRPIHQEMRAYRTRRLSKRFVSECFHRRFGNLAKQFRGGEASFH